LGDNLRLHSQRHTHLDRLHIPHVIIDHVQVQGSVKGQISNGIIMQPTFGIEKMRQFANRLGFVIIPRIFGLH
jgi:hypothetical protein